MWRWLPLVLVLLLCGGLLAYEGVDRLVRAAGLLMRWTHAPGPEAIRNYGAHEVTRRPFTFTLTTREVEALEYLPTDQADTHRAPPVLLIHGAHFQGIHEPRIQAFARALASAGLRVITPHLEEITHHNVTPGTLNTIQQVARLAAHRTHYETVGVIGVSFSGSLALLAAAQEQPGAGSTKVIANVAAVGAYVSIAHLGRWYAGLDAVGPDHQLLPFKPHPYGARVLFQAHADTVFGEHAADVKRALAFYISDQPERAQAFAATLPEPPRSDVQELVSDVPHPLSAKLLSLLEQHKPELAAISPEGQLATLNVPVLLVHGSDDPIVPSTETLWLEREVPRHALRQSLVTSAIRHAELEAKPSIAELWALVQWASALLEVNEKQSRAPRIQ